MGNELVLTSLWGLQLNNSLPEISIVARVDTGPVSTQRMRDVQLPYGNPGSFFKLHVHTESCAHV